LEEAILPAGETDTDLVALDDALEELKVIDERRYKIVMLWYFVGLTQEEIAAELSISVNTVGRQLRAARLWLRHEMDRRRDPTTET
jgi:RNA polymerase sigma factor (sigma-70 family)